MTCVCCCCCVLLRAALGGPLPASITQMRSLEVLSLESNGFTGPLPPNLCSDLTVLKVRAERVLEVVGWRTSLSWTVRPRAQPVCTHQSSLLHMTPWRRASWCPCKYCLPCCCRQAVSLRDNKFEGQITQFSSCVLQSLDVSDNMFTGSLPVPLPSTPRARAPWLRLMSIAAANNRLTGSLPEFPYGSVSSSGGRCHPAAVAATAWQHQGCRLA